MAQVGDKAFVKDPGRDEPIVQIMPSKEEMKLIGAADWSGIIAQVGDKAFTKDPGRDKPIVQTRPSKVGDKAFAKDPGRDEPTVQTMPSKEEGMKLIGADWSDDELLSGRPETVEYDTTSVPEFEGERMIDYVPAVQIARLGYQAVTHLPELAAYAKEHAPRDFFDGVSKFSKVVKGMAENDPIGTALLPVLSVMPYRWSLLAADMLVPWGYGSIPEHPLRFKNARELQDDTVDFADRYIVPVARKITDMTKPLTDFMLGAGKRMQRSIK